MERRSESESLQNRWGFRRKAPVCLLGCEVCGKPGGSLIFNDRSIRDKIQDLLKCWDARIVHSQEEAEEYCLSPGVITPGGTVSAKCIQAECPCGTSIGMVCFPNAKPIWEFHHLLHIDKTLIRCVSCAGPSPNSILNPQGVQ